MQRRFGFLVSMTGLVFVIAPIVKVLERPDYLVFCIGAGLTIVGIFASIESLAKPK